MSTSAWQGPFGTPQKNTASTNEDMTSSAGNRTSRQVLESAFTTPVRRPRGPTEGSSGFMDVLRGTQSEKIERRVSSISKVEAATPSRHEMSSNWRANAGPRDEYEANYNTGLSRGTASPVMMRGKPNSRAGSVTSGTGTTLSVKRDASSVTESHAGYDINSSSVILVARERAITGENPSEPSFMAKFASLQTTQNFYDIVLPQLSTYTFVLESSADLNYMASWFKASVFPTIQNGITKVAFPKLYWFSGTHSNRKANPSIAFAAALPCLTEITLTFHTAGLTASTWPERDRLRMEQYDEERSKQLKVLRLQDVVKIYDLSRLFYCVRLEKIHLECYNSPMVKHFTRSSDPLSPFRDLKHWIETGFVDYYGKHVEVDSRVFQIEA